MTVATAAVILMLAMTGAGITAIAEIGDKETGAHIMAAITGGFITVAITGVTLRHIIRKPITRQTITWSGVPFAGFITTTVTGRIITGAAEAASVLR